MFQRIKPWIPRMAILSVFCWIACKSEQKTAEQIPPVAQKPSALNGQWQFQDDYSDGSAQTGWVEIKDQWSFWFNGESLDTMKISGDSILMKTLEGKWDLNFIIVKRSADTLLLQLPDQSDTLSLWRVKDPNQVFPGWQNESSQNATQIKPEPVPFAGVYFITGWLTNVLGSRSPFWADQQSYSKGGEWAFDCLVIPDSTGKPIFNLTLQDSIVVAHENGKWLLKNIHSGSEYRAIRIEESGEISYADVNENVSFRGMGRLSVGNYSYDRVDGFKPEYGQGKLPNYYHEFLFKGSYKTTSGQRIEFFDDGRIQGLALAKYYQAWPDYSAPGSNTNLIYLGSGSDIKKMKLYDFEFLGEAQDTLVFRNLKTFDAEGDPLFGEPLPDGMSQVADREVFRLIRIPKEVQK